MVFYQDRKETGNELEKGVLKLFIEYLFKIWSPSWGKLKVHVQCLFHKSFVNYQEREWAVLPVTICSNSLSVLEVND